MPTVFVLQLFGGASYFELKVCGIIRKRTKILGTEPTDERNCRMHEDAQTLLGGGAAAFTDHCSNSQS